MHLQSRNTAQARRLSVPALLAVECSHSMERECPSCLRLATRAYPLLRLHSPLGRRNPRGLGQRDSGIERKMAVALDINARPLAPTLLDQALKDMPLGVLIAEAPSGRLIYANEQVRLIWRHATVPAVAMDGYGEYKGFHADGRPYEPGEWPLACAILLGETIIDREIVFERGDGTRGVMSASAAPIVRDEEETGNSFGQRVRDTFPIADLFVIATERTQIEPAIRRFIELVFGHPFHTPSVDEFAMFHARSTALRSSDLSRQVGCRISSAGRQSSCRRMQRGTKVRRWRILARRPERSA